MTEFLASCIVIVMVIRSKEKFLYSSSLKELLSLFFPLLLFTFSNYVFLIVEKLLLARLSVMDMEAAVNAAYACQIFQMPTVALTSMAQVYVARWYGAKEWTSIGPGIWQLVWFSFLSQILIIPLGLFYGPFYFAGTVIENIVYPYYHFLLGINFIYPLSATLTCFYLGQGKTGLILLSTIGSQILKLCLGFLLIFGWGNWIPPFGLLGGALSTLLAQGTYCLVLGTILLNKFYDERFQTRQWYFNLKLFWETIYPGLLRALNRLLNLGSWVLIARMMMSKGGDYILSLSIGGTLFLFLPFLGDALCQAQTTIVSQLIGMKKYHLLNKAFNSALFLVITSIILIGIPLVLFPYTTFQYLFPAIPLKAEAIQLILFGVWTTFIFFTFSYVPLSYILSFKDMKFPLFLGAMSWVYGYSLLYLMVEKAQMSAELFWLALSIMHALNGFFYFLRMKWLQSRVMVPILSGDVA